MISLKNGIAMKFLIFRALAATPKEARSFSGASQFRRQPELDGFFATGESRNLGGPKAL
jgi:hypothetical protein